MIADLPRAAAVGHLMRNPSLMPMIRRKRDRAFVANLVVALAQNGGALDDDVIADAMSATLEVPHKDDVAARAALLRKGRAKLKLSVIGASIAEFYEVAADMTLAEAAQLHAEHIRGLRYKATVIDEKTGKAKTVIMREKPNYQALKDFQHLVLPREPKQVQVDSRTLVARMNVGENYRQPEIDPLPIATENDV